MYLLALLREHLKQTTFLATLKSSLLHQALKSCAVHINKKSQCSMEWLLLWKCLFLRKYRFTYYYHLVCKCISIIKDSEEPCLLTCIRIFYYNVRNLKEFERQGHLSVGSNSFQQPRKEGCTCHLQDKQRCCKSNTFQNISL